MDWIAELDKLIQEAGLTVTFDIYRDCTKGCGSHCRAWGGSQSTTYCENHKAAILRGDYLVPGGSIQGAIEKLQTRLKDAVAENERLRPEIQYFVDRCEGRHPDGPIQSRRTYLRFKQALTPSPGGEDGG